MKLFKGLILIIFISHSLGWADQDNVDHFFSDLRTELVQTFYNSNLSFYGKNALYRQFMAEKKAYDLGVELIKRFKKLSKQMDTKQVVEAVEVFAEMQRDYKIKFYTTKSSSNLIPFDNPNYQQSDVVPANIKVRGYSKKYKEKATRLARLTIHQSRDMILGSFVLGAIKSATKDNPLGMADAIKESTDPIFLATMPAFTLIDYKVEKAFGNPKSFFPRQLARYSAMSAGFFVTGIMEEFLRDVLMGDGAECRSSSETEASNEACVRFWDRWSTRDKYASYTPEAMALMMAAATAAGASAPVLKAIQQAKHMTIRVVEKKTLPIVLANIGKQIAKQGALSLLGAPRFVYTAGNMAIIIGLQEYYSPIVNTYWRPLNLQYLGWSLPEELKKDKEKTSTDFIRTKKEVDKELKDLDANIDKLNEYSSKQSMEKCIQEGMNRILPEHLVPNIPGEEELYDSKTDDLVISNKPIVRVTQKCRRKGIPSFLLKADSAFNKAELSNQLANFEIKQQNWHRLVGDFTENYKVARAIYKYVLDLKRTSDKSIEDLLNDELSKENLQNLAKEVGTQRPTAQAPAANKNAKGKKTEEVKQYNDFINGAKFNSMADFVIYHMACGPTVDNKGLHARAKREFDNSADVEFIKTPFGSSLEFLPPKVTTGNNDVCKSVERVYRDMNKRSLGIDKSLIPRLHSEDGDIYLPIWKSKDEGTYRSLVAYMYDNLDEDVVNYDELITGDYAWEELDYDFKWWTKSIRAEVNNVWDVYDTAYQSLIRSELLPILIPADESANQNTKASKGRNSPRFAGTATRQKKIKSLYIDTTIKRVEKGFARLLKIAEMSKKEGIFSGVLTPFVEKYLNEGLESFKAEANFHQDYLNYWNNFDDLYESDDEESKIKESVFDSLKKLSDLYQNASRVGSYYSIEHLRYIANNTCDSDSLKKMQNEVTAYEYGGPELVWMNHIPADKMKSDEAGRINYVTLDPKSNRSKQYRDLTCSDGDKKYAKQLLDRNSKEEFYFGLVGTQIEVLLSEMENYFSILTKLTKSIGYKKKEL